MQTAVFLQTCVIQHVRPPPSLCTTKDRSGDNGDDADVPYLRLEVESWKRGIRGTYSQAEDPINEVV